MPEFFFEAREKKMFTEVKSSLSQVRLLLILILEAEVYILKKEEGGRHTPFFNGYKPQFYIRTTDVTGEVTLPEKTENGYAGRYDYLQGKLVAPVALEEKK